MSPQPLRVLYVEDELIQQKLMAHALKGVAEYACEVVCESTEEGGVAVFRRGGFDAVVADYHLAQGNGLNLVRRLREIDPVVPIIAVSALAPDEIATDMILSGADDYLDKSSLDTRALGRRLRVAVLRSVSLRNRLPAAPVAEPGVAEVRAVVRWLSSAGATELTALLARCTSAVRSSGIEPKALAELFEAAVPDVVAASGLSPDHARAAIRPFLLDLITRLNEQPTP